MTCRALLVPGMASVSPACQLRLPSSVMAAFRANLLVNPALPETTRKSGRLSVRLLKTTPTLASADAFTGMVALTEPIFVVSRWSRPAFRSRPPEPVKWKPRVSSRASFTVNASTGWSTGRPQRNGFVMASEPSRMWTCSRSSFRCPAAVTVSPGVGAGSLAAPSRSRMTFWESADASNTRSELVTWSASGPSATGQSGTKFFTRPATRPADDSVSFASPSDTLSPEAPAHCSRGGGVNDPASVTTMGGPPSPPSTTSLANPAAFCTACAASPMAPEMLVMFTTMLSPSGSRSAGSKGRGSMVPVRWPSRMPAFRMVSFALRRPSGRSSGRPGKLSSMSKPKPQSAGACPVNQS